MLSSDNNVYGIRKRHTEQHKVILSSLKYCPPEVLAIAPPLKKLYSLNVVLNGTWVVSDFCEWEVMDGRWQI